ncbi:MAG: hypothetical protein ACTHOC_11370 [Luteimonas sp.]
MGKGRLAALAAMLMGLAAMHAAGAKGAGDLARTASQAAAMIDAEVAGKHMVMLGEMHGTAECPAVAGELAVRWTSGAHAQPVLLGLEVTSLDQARVDRYLASAGSAADRADLLAGEHWVEPHHDGRDSAAMASLLERVRALRAGGADISVALFDAPGDGERDGRMADALRRAIAAHPAARVLTLAGNVHAMTGEPPQTFVDGKPYTLPVTMARRLADLHPVSVDIRAMQGDMWVCQDTCGVHPLPPPRRAIDTPELARNDPGSTWDYRIALPRFTASLPAVPGASAR